MTCPRAIHLALNECKAGKIETGLQSPAHRQPHSERGQHRGAHPSPAAASSHVRGKRSSRLPQSPNTLTSSKPFPLNWSSLAPIPGVLSTPAHPGSRRGRLCRAWGCPAPTTLGRLASDVPQQRGRTRPDHAVSPVSGSGIFPEAGGTEAWMKGAAGIATVRRCPAHTISSWPV